MDVKAVLKYVDLNGLAEDILSSVVKPKLQALVDDTSNSFDNVAFELAYPVIEKAIKDAAAKAKE